TGDPGASRDFFGSRLGGAGDVNGDGYDDIVVLAPSYSPTGAYSVGRAYVYYGSADGVSSTADWRFTGRGVNPFGSRISGFAGGGDVNGDGFADLALAEIGTLVFHGSPGGLPSAPTSSLPPGSFAQYYAHEWADFDGDGFSDLVVNVSAFGLAPAVGVIAGSAAGLGSSPFWLTRSDQPD